MLRHVSKTLLHRTCGPAAATRAFAAGSAHRHGDDREAAAHAAAQDLASATRSSIQHAAQGDLGAVTSDAVRMAAAGARGAAASAFLVMERVAGLGGSVGSRGSHAAQSAASAAASVAEDLSVEATAVYRETVGSRSGTSVPGGPGTKGPESTYHDHALKDAGPASPSAATTVCTTGDWAGVMVQSAADEAPGGGGGGSEGAAVGGEDIGGSRKGSGAGGAGFAAGADGGGELTDAGQAGTDPHLAQRS